MGELAPRIETARQLLNALDGLHTRISMANTQQQTYQAQATTLQEKKGLLKAQLDSQQITADTYDRQFQDLINAAPKKPFLGLRTVQDWVLTGFFFAFAVLILCVALYAGRLYGGSTTGIVFGAGIVLLIMTGVLMLQVA
jgi:lipopolysaccharide export LptBFGC system permease protein LptF